MTSKYGINDIVEMKNNMLVVRIDLKLFVWALIFVSNAKM